MTADELHGRKLIAIKKHAGPVSNWLYTEINLSAMTV